MRIAFIHPQDTNNRNLWSGTVFYLCQSCRENFDDFVVFSPIKENFVLIKYFFKMIEYIGVKITGKQQLNLYNSYLLPKIQSRRIDKFLNGKKINCIITTIASPFIYSRSNIPLILITDATVKLLSKEYSDGETKPGLFFRKLEKNAIKVTLKSALIVTSSTSTSDSLINDYKIPTSKIATIPFGANIENEEIRVPERIIDKTRQLKVLFVGKEWDRKGGDFVVAVCDALIKQNIKILLNIVGCTVPEEFRRSYIKNYTYLDKNLAEDFIKLRELYIESHFFMGFSKAEMYGIVFCEAAAYGLPVVAFSVGGISDIVINEKTGILLDKETNPELFASKIIELISDSLKYKSMSDEAFRRYKELLNWDAFTKTLKCRLDNIIIQDLHNI
jgi:alpha-maltose-1-phosphate synthase